MDRCVLRRCWTVLLTAILAVTCGCALRHGGHVRPWAKPGLFLRPQMLSQSPTSLTSRTIQFLRQHNLDSSLHEDPRTLLQQVQAVIQKEPQADNVYAYAEISYVLAKRVERSQPRLALDFYGGTVLKAYQYLFDPKFEDTRNPYDPRFRGACDLYNSALEAALRIVRANESLQPGSAFSVRTADGYWTLTCTICDRRWRAEDFGTFEFVSDYRITGLRNHHVHYGLGVPMIAVRKNYPGEPPAARYYPPDLSFPVTVFLRPEIPSATESQEEDRHYEGRLELYDPVATMNIQVGNYVVPLQADLTTPLATFLSNPALGSSLATVGLLRPEKLLTLQPGLNKPLTGLYMVQPYEPDKIPVIMIHGWWSSPMTWIQMFNDLRSDPLIRRRYQFWFYLYPTGQPFWISAAQFRRDLRELRQTLDPDHRQPALDQIVLIGHSMGGLIAELQTIDSGQDFWKLVSEHPFEEIRTDPISREELREIFFFQPNPSIRRIITIATPHLGSHFSNQMTQRLAARLISVPKELLQSQTQFFRENQDLLLPNNILQITDSVDALDPDCPIFALMNQARRASWIVHHNIVGASLEDRLWGRITGTSDGVISWESAHSDKADSEIAVPAEHTSVQSHPLTILEVKRILLEHLAELHQEHSLFTSGALPADVAVPSPVRLPPVEYP
ncbi:MAG: alpha/beta hydrolase [Thermogutta sp.]|nr:alpha/beta hydrolase [Thermogutta sp.]HPU07283.1 alpha/beta hydrolase [Thermogutta sp.]HQF13712.1 alpha/beta hydrolase [Thermogutta sp.]